MYFSNVDLRRERGRLWDISPFFEEHVQPNSIDIRLGGEYVDPDDGITVYKDEIVLAPGAFINGVSEDKIWLSAGVMGELHGRSSWGREGLLVHATAGYADAGWHGYLTLELKNLRQRTGLRLERGWRIGQLAIAILMTPADPPYQGKYQDAPGVQASRWRLDPETTGGGHARDW